MDSKSKFLRMFVFVVVTVSILVFLYAIIFRVDLFGKNYTLQVQFDSIGTIKPGSPVRKRGVRIGDVKAINMNKNDLKTVLVVLSIHSNYIVQKEDKLRIVTTGILGDQYIDITPADQASSPATSEDIILGESSLGDISSLGASFASFLKDNQKTFEKILHNIEEITTEMNSSLPEVRATLKNIHSISENFKNFTSSFNNQNGLATFLNKKETLDNINIILNNMSSFSSDLKKIGNVLQKSLP